MNKKVWLVVPFLLVAAIFIVQCAGRTSEKVVSPTAAVFSFTALPTFTPLAQATPTSIVVTNCTGNAEFVLFDPADYHGWIVKGNDFVPDMSVEQFIAATPVDVQIQQEYLQAVLEVRTCPDGVYVRIIPNANFVPVD